MYLMLLCVTGTNRIIHCMRQKGGNDCIRIIRNLRKIEIERNDKKFEKDIEPFRLPFFVNKIKGVFFCV